MRFFAGSTRLPKQLANFPTVCRHPFILSGLLGNFRRSISHSSRQAQAQLFTEPRRETVVFLDGHVPPPDFSFPHQLRRYSSTSPSEIAERISDATIVCTATCPLGRIALRHAKRLRLVACLGTGNDHIDHTYLKDKGITLCNVPSVNSESVAEHAIALHFAIQRSIVNFDSAIRSGSPGLVKSMIGFVASSQLRTCKEHVIGVIGFGSVGMQRYGLTDEHCPIADGT